ncbi:hypothetical protein C169_00055 [Paenibacillus sp. FSL R5-808]|nr:hypothetical protein C169_00055 [Paenibacillus sp. FSL R5-808]
MFLTSFVSIIGIIVFWPRYVDNDFPLFTDIFMVFIFLPSFFILFSILSFLINRFFIRKISIKILLSVILYGLSFFASYFLFKDIWSFNVRFISISLTSLVGLIHYLISYGLSLVNSAIRKKLDENIG